MVKRYTCSGETPSSRFPSGMSHVAVENALGLDQQVSRNIFPKAVCVDLFPGFTWLVAQY